MNNSKLFKSGHRLVKETFSKFGKADYRSTFGACVKAIIGGFLTRRRNADIRKSSTARKPNVNSVPMMAKEVAKLTKCGAIGIRTALAKLGYPDSLFKNQSFHRAVTSHLMSI